MKHINLRNHVFVQIEFSTFTSINHQLIKPHTQMTQFKNIFATFNPMQIQMNFRKLVETRRAKLIQQGLEVNSINWEHYAKVLEAKTRLFNSL